MTCDAVDLTSRLIRCPSVTPEEGGAIQLLDRLLTDAGFTKGFARASVVAGSVADLGLGLGVLKRAWTRWSCLGMIAVSAFYLIAATIFVPGLWGDPLGPLVKVLPSMMLALMVALMLERR